MAAQQRLLGLHAFVNRFYGEPARRAGWELFKQTFRFL
jgi:hypothetical protein